MLARIPRIQLDIRGLERQLATAAHRIACIDNQVDQHLLQLSRVGTDPPQVVSQDGPDGYP